MLQWILLAIGIVVVAIVLAKSAAAGANVESSVEVTLEEPVFQGDFVKPLFNDRSKKSQQSEENALKQALPVVAVKATPVPAPPRPAPPMVSNVVAAGTCGDAVGRQPVYREKDGMRMFSREECDLCDGNHFSNGECLKKSGGSYSWDYRMKT